MDISTLNIDQLKSLAYDQKVAIEQGQLNLRVIEDRIRQINHDAAVEAAAAAEAASEGQPPKDAGSAEPTSDAGQQNDEQQTPPAAPVPTDTPA